MTVGPSGPGGGPGRRLGRIIGRSSRWPPVRDLVAVLEAHAAVGGGVLAAGLAFGAVFAAIPTILLALGLAGLFVADPAVRAGVALELARRIPPLEGMAGPVLDRLAAEAGGVSLLGLATPAVFGPLATAFATLAWLSWAFQLLLVGGSWVRLRSDRVPGGDAGGSGLAGAAPAAEAGRRGEGQPAADAGLDA